MDEQLNNEKEKQPVAPQQPISQNTDPQPQQTTTPTQQTAETNNIQKKAPLLVIIIAWLMLLGGIGQLLASFVTILLNPIIGALYLIIAIGLIVVSFGIRHLKTWALKTYIVIGGLSIVSSIYGIIISQKIDDRLAHAGSIIISILLILYFWRLLKGLPQKFV